VSFFTDKKSGETTMKIVKFAAFIAAIVVSLGAHADGAKITKLATADASEGDAGDKQVVFLANNNSTSSLLGTAVVCLHDGDKFGGAFGLTTKDNKGVIGAVKHETVKPLADPKDPKATITRVIVTEGQYAAVKKNLDAWSAKEKFGDDASRSSVNFVVEVLAALKLKQPYLSGLRSVNPVQFYGDIPAMNRKKIVEE
jgi:hypothetical protein